MWKQLALRLELTIAITIAATDFSTFLCHCLIKYHAYTLIVLAILAAENDSWNVVDLGIHDHTPH